MKTRGMVQLFLVWVGGMVFGQTSHYLSHFSYKDGVWLTELSLYNDSDSEASCTLKVRDESGLEIAQIQLELPGNQGFLGTLPSLAPDTFFETGWIEILCGNPLAGMVTVTQLTTGATTSLPLSTEISNHYFFPRLSENEKTMSGVSITNLQESALLVKVLLKDHNGSIWKQSEIHLDPHAKWTSMLETYFGPNLPEDGILEIFADQPLLGFGLSFSRNLQQMIAVPPVISSQSQPSTSESLPIQTGDGWQTSQMEHVGLDPEAITQTWADLAVRQDHLVEGLVIIKDNQLVFEQYLNGHEFDLTEPENLLINGDLNLYPVSYSREEMHFLASCTKSVTSILVGIAIQEGFISDVQAPIHVFFPDYAAQFDALRSTITIEDLLTMRSGILFDDSSYPIHDARNEESQLFFGSDPIEWALSRPITYTPGTVYDYNSGSTVLLGEIVARASQMDLLQFADQYLFSKLDIENRAWASCANEKRVSFASGGLYLRPRDMAKLGQLMIQAGQWQGQQVVSAAWARESIVPRTDLGDGRGYGYQWWSQTSCAGDPVFYAAGWGGQFIMCVPDKQLVVVMTQGDYSGDFENPVEQVFCDILTAITNSTEPNFKSFNLLLKSE